jgi:hypothetical protein
MKTVSSNAGMSIAEDIFGGNAGAFEMEKNAAIIGRGVIALAPGTGMVARVAGEAMGMAAGKVKGKNSKGGKTAFSPENAKDVEEYLDNNKGARSATGIRSNRASGIKGKEAESFTKEFNMKNHSSYEPPLAIRKASQTEATKTMSTATESPNPIVSPSSNLVANSITKSGQNVNAAQQAVSETSSAIETLNSTSDKAIGQAAMANIVDNKINSLSSGSLGGSQHTSLAQLKNDITGEGNVGAAQFSKAMEMNFKDFAQSGIVTSGTGGTRILDMESIGSVVRPSVENSLGDTLNNANVTLHNAKVEFQSMQGAASMSGPVQHQIEGSQFSGSFGSSPRPAPQHQGFASNPLTHNSEGTQEVIQTPQAPTQKVEQAPTQMPTQEVAQTQEQTQTPTPYSDYARDSEGHPNAKRHPFEHSALYGDNYGDKNAIFRTPSVAPQHQGFASNPSTYHSDSAYVTPQEANTYHNDTSRSSDESLSEMRVGSDMNLEATEEMRDTIQTLTETLYNKENS